MHGAPFHAALSGSLARQPCPAALPGSLARQPCPAALPGSLANKNSNCFLVYLGHGSAEKLCFVTL
jgi:hypothetical protein